jgi:hypothetical protein
MKILKLVLLALIVISCNDFPTTPREYPRSLIPVVDARTRLTLGIHYIPVRQQLILNLQFLENLLRDPKINVKQIYNVVSRINVILDNYKATSDVADVSAIRLALNFVLKEFG